MTDGVLVSIKVENGKYEEDFEIPLNIKAENWIETIKVYFVQKRIIPESLMSEKLIITYNNHIIQDSDTLMKLGVADGSVLSVGWR